MRALLRELQPDGAGARGAAPAEAFERGDAGPASGTDVVRRHGLEHALHRLAEVVRPYGVEVGIDFARYSPRAGEEEVEMFRICQEAMANAVRHARPRRIEVQSETTAGGGVRLKVRDDGRGFDPRALSPATSGDMGDMSEKGGYGLANMRERAASLGGKLRVTSSPGQGTTIALEVRGTGR